MGKINTKQGLRRKIRVRSGIFGTKDKPRVSVFASNRYTYAQVIDDSGRTTLAAYSSLQISQAKDYKKGKKVEEAKNVGLSLAKEMKKKGIKQAVLDRGRYAYKGRVKSLTEGLREGGLQI